MALPAGTDYATASVPAPASDLTEFVLLVDLSRLPQAWWDAVDTADATKGRAAKHGDGTELPSDWIEFDSDAQTGKVRVRWTGTLAAAGGDVLRLYPPQAANTSYAAGDTYGQHAVYEAKILRYSANGGAQDRTANEIDGSERGGVTSGGGGGPVGDATDYDGSDDWIDLGSPAALSGLSAFTYMWWSNWSGSGNAVVYASGNTGDSYHLVGYDTDYGMANSGKIDLGLDGAVGVQSTSDAPTAGAHVAITWDGSDVRFIIDGVLDATEALADVQGFGGWKSVGARTEGSVDRAYGGLLADLRLESSARPVDYLKHESDQILDQASFWGTWTWQGGGGASSNLVILTGPLV